MSHIDAQALAFQPLFQWLLGASLSAAGIAVIVLVVQTLLSRWLTPAWRYRLWFLVVLRLLLPVLPTSPTSILNLARLLPARNDPAPPTATLTPARTEIPTDSRWKTIVTVVVDPVQIIAQSPPQSPLPSKQVKQTHFSASLVLASMWGIVAFLLLVRLTVVNALLNRRLRGAVQIDDDRALTVLQECGRLMHVRRPPRFLITDAVRVPATAGVWKSQVLLPPGLLNSLSHDELQVVLLHELSHVRCRDVALNWLLALLQIAHWFNPVIWWAMSRMRDDREAARDAEVLRLSSSNDQGRASAGYAQTLLKLTEFLASRPIPAAAPMVAGMIEPTRSVLISGMLGGHRSLQRRFTMIDRFATRSSRLTFVGPILLLSLGSVLLTDAKGINRQETNAATRPAPATPDNAAGPIAAERNDRQTGDRERMVMTELERPLPTVQFDAVNFDDVIDYLQTASGTKISVNWKALEAPAGPSTLLQIAPTHGAQRGALNFTESS